MLAERERFNQDGESKEIEILLLGEILNFTR